MVLYHSTVNNFISDFDDIDIKISLVIIIDRMNRTFESSR